MKQGKDIKELADELQRQQDVKKDYLADTRRLELLSNGDLVMKNGQEHFLNTNDNFHDQMAYRLGIPNKYYQRMRMDQPDLLATNVNTWFQSEGKTRMIRTLDGTARAFLSDRYRTLDNYDLANSVLPILNKVGADVRSMDITENKFYLKAVIPSQCEIIAPEGVNVADLKFDGTMRDQHIFVDEIEPGIVISNSETGCGGLNVWPGVHTRRCTNMATFRGNRFKKTHIGSPLQKLLQEGQHLAEYIKDDTRRIADQAVWSTVRDFVEASCTGTVFKELADKYRESRGHKIESDNLPKVIEVAAERFGLGDQEQGGILRHLIEGGELSKYGLSNAVTQFSQRSEVGYDRASDLEMIGADIIELPKQDWDRIAVAA